MQAIQIIAATKGMVFAPFQSENRYRLCLSASVENRVWFSRELWQCMYENGYGFQRPGLEKCMDNDIFWSEIGSGFREPGGTPHQEFPGVPPWVSRNIGPLLMPARHMILFQAVTQPQLYVTSFISPLCQVLTFSALDFLKALRFLFPVPVVAFGFRRHKKSLFAIRR